MRKSFGGGAAAMAALARNSCRQIMPEMMEKRGGDKGRRFARQGFRALKKARGFISHDFAA